MLPTSPMREFLDVFPNSMIISVEEVRSIFINKKSVLINEIIAISCNMISRLDDQDFFIVDVSKSFGYNTT